MFNRKNKKPKQNNNDPQKRQHSFYGEAEKSFMKKEGFTKQNVWKWTKKIAKWSTYGFLTVTTIWGCVNQMRHSTSQNVSQGIEFYGSYEDVISNVYNSEKLVSYSREGEKKFKAEYRGEEVDLENPDGIDALAPLDFYVLNPNYGAEYYTTTNKRDYKELTEEVKKEAQVEKAIINSSEIVNITRHDRTQESIVSFSHVASHHDINLQSNIISRDLEPEWRIDDIDGVDSENNGILIESSLPAELWDLEDDEKIDREKDVITWSRYFLENKLFIEKEYDDYWRKDDDGEFVEENDKFDRILTGQESFVLNSNGVDKVNNNSSSDLKLVKDDFEVRENVTESITKEEEWNKLDDSEKVEYIHNQGKWIIRRLSFFEGKEIDENYVIENKPIKQHLNEFLESEGIINLDFNNRSSYKIDVPAILFGSNYKDDDNLVYGTEFTVFGQSQGNPIRPEVETFRQMQKNMSEALETLPGNHKNFNSLDTTNTPGVDGRVQNAGWGLLDNKGKLQEVYKKDKDNPDKEVKDYMWAMQMATNRGHIQYDNSKEGFGFIDNFGEINYEHSDWKDYERENEEEAMLVFDQKNELMRKNDFYTKEEQTFSIGYGGVNDDTRVELKVEDIEVDYKGFTPLRENPLRVIMGAGDAIPPSKQVNHMTSYDIRRVKDEDGEWIYNAHANSKFNDLIRSSKQDSWNHKRILFASWGDWGRAWGSQFGPMFGMFVLPLSQISIGIQSWMPPYLSNWGGWGAILSMYLIVLMLRGLGTLLTLKQQDQQTKMQSIQGEIAAINAKYEKFEKEDKQAQSRKQQEIMALYRKHDISPFGSIGSVMITMPIFLSLWTIIAGTPSYKVAMIGNFSLAVTPFYGMFNMGAMVPAYMLLGVVVVMAQAFSSKVPQWLADKRKGVKRVDEATIAARKKQNRTQTVMIWIFAFMGLTVPSLLSIYWTFSAMYTITVEMIKHIIQVKKADGKRKEALAK